MSLAEVGEKKAALTVHNAKITVPKQIVGTPADLTKLLPGNLQKSKYAPALAAAINKNIGAGLLANKKTQANLTFINTQIEAAAIRKVTGTQPSPGTVSALTGVNAARTAAIANAAIQTNSTVIQPLAGGTVAGVIATDKLLETTAKYTDLMQKYNDVMEKGTPGKEGIDFKKILIYAAIAVGALIVGSMLIKKVGKE